MANTVAIGTARSPGSPAPLARRVQCGRQMRPGFLHAGRALALALLLGGLAGCGSSSSSSSSSNGVAAKPPAQIVAATKAAADAAESVHVSGSIVTGGTPITLDMDLRSGSGGRGKLSENGLAFELIQTGGTVYIKGSSDFYKRIGGSAAAQLLQGRWLKAPTSNADFASIASLTDLKRLVDTALASHGALAKGAQTSVNGQKAIALRDTSNGGTLYVATTGKPYPLEIRKSGAEGGKVEFTRWNEPVSLGPPRDAIDVSQLRAAG
jgi:hypothetical protein